MSKSDFERRKNRAYLRERQRVHGTGTEHQDNEFINAYVRENYDLTPKGIIEKLGLLNVDYNKVSSYDHFGKAGLPWEE